MSYPPYLGYGVLTQQCAILQVPPWILEVVPPLHSHVAWHFAPCGTNRKHHSYFQKIQKAQTVSNLSTEPNWEIVTDTLF